MRLSTVVLPHHDMARWAVARLLERGSAPLVPARVKMDCEPVLRASIAPPRRV
jgi:LacI family transcriptional regulator